jgi:hypothetical protein
MPAGAINDESGVRVRCDVLGDLGKQQVHRVGVAGRQDERRAFAFLGAYSAEDIGRGSALIMRRARSRSAFRPSTGDLVLLADARLVFEPDFYLVDADAFFARDCVQARREVFLKSSIAPSVCA